MADINTSNPNELLDTPEASAFLKRKGRASLDIQRHRGLGPRYIKIGGRILYRRSDLEAYLEANTIDPGQAKTRPVRAKKTAAQEQSQVDNASLPDFSGMKRGLACKKSA